MTMERDPGCSDPDPPRKSYNPFDSDDENVFTKEDCIGFDLEAFGENADALAFDIWEEAAFSEASEKNVQRYYTDSSEFVVGINESAYQSVKDIGVDEGVPTKNKNQAQSSEDLLSGKHQVHEFGGGDSVKIAELKLDSVETDSGDLVYDVADDRPALEMHPNRKAFELDEPGSIGEDGDEDEDSVEKNLDTASLDKHENVFAKEPAADLSTEHGEAEFKPDKSPREEETLPESSEHRVAVDESAHSSDSNKVSNDTKTESGSVTYNFSSPTNSDPEKQEDELQDAEVAKLPAATRLEKEALSSSAITSQEATARGETSFSSFTSSITFAAPVAYSGSLSLQSESSAGSTRSFAFPVLQTEWISSPERMARADRRRYWKLRGWLRAVICCRF